MSSDQVGAFVAYSHQQCGFPLVATLVLMLVLVMGIVMDMLVSMLLSYMLVIVAIMSMSLFLVLMFVYMFIFCMATHTLFTSFPVYYYYNTDEEDYLGPIPNLLAQQLDSEELTISQADSQQTPYTDAAGSAYDV